MISNVGQTRSIITILSILLLLNFPLAIAQHQAEIIVDQGGNGDVKTLMEAIAMLPMYNYQRTVIFVKNGVYSEKIRIEQDNITLRGENREKTTIKFPQLRLDWDEHRDAIGPAVINIYADDIVLENLTVENTQSEIGPHAFAIYGTGTRTIIKDCSIVSKGGDTIALWNYKNGMYYLADCSIKGAVDFVCPRGWCFIKNSEFYEMKETAAIWHAGGFERDQKLVIVDSKFDGVPGFKLGRHHYDAQFYLLNCQFSQQMSDNPIYRVTYPDEPERDRPFNWGERYFFYNCHRQNGDFGWFADNLNKAKGSPNPEDITAAWTFGGRWDPESASGPTIQHYEVFKNSVLFQFSEIVSVIGRPVLKSESGKSLSYHSGGGSNTIRFDSEGLITRNDLKKLIVVNDGQLLGTVATVNNRPVDFRI